MKQLPKVSVKSKEFFPRAELVQNQNISVLRDHDPQPRSMLGTNVLKRGRLQVENGLEDHSYI